MSEIGESIARLCSALEKENAYGLPRQELLALRENFGSRCPGWIQATNFDEAMLWDIIFFVRGTRKWLADLGIASQAIHSELANIERACLDEIRRRLVDGRRVASE
jgi:hypothetical protein